MTTPDTLIILGASARAAAESAVRAGFTPHCIDLFADADTQALGTTKRIDRYPAEFLPALAAAPEAPWMYTGSLENYPRLISRLAAVRTLWGNDAETLRLVRDPHWLADLLTDEAIQYPEAIVAGEPLVVVRGQESGEWLSKPSRSGGGMAILTGNGDQESGVRDRVFQRFVAGVSFSASFLAASDDVHFIGAAGQWNGTEFGAPQRFQYAGSYAPFMLSTDEQRSLLDLAAKLVTSAGLRGLFGLDMIRGERGLWLIEVNPRYTASMELLEAIRGRSLVAEHCAAINCELPSPAREKAFSNKLSTSRYMLKEGVISRPESTKSQISLSKQLSTGNSHDGSELTYGKLIVYANRAGVAGGCYQRDLAVIRDEMGVIAADIPPAESVISHESPVSSLLSVGPTVEAVRSTLITAAGRIRQSLAPIDHPS